MSEDGRNLPNVVRLSVIAAIGGFLFGFDSGVINGTVEGLQTAFNSDRIGTGFNVASMLLGCAVGAFIAGQLAIMSTHRDGHCSGTVSLKHLGIGHLRRLGRIYNLQNYWWTCCRWR